MFRKGQVLLSFCLIFFISCNKQEKLDNICANQDIELRLCPQKNGKLFLPRTYTANALYVGYSSGSNHYEFIKNLIDLLDQGEHFPKINVLVPRVDIMEVQELFKSYFEHPKSSLINFYPSISSETIWMQDYFEILTNMKSGRPEFVDLPYTDREGELIPASLSITCKEGMIESPNYSKVVPPPGNGDYGGNIEPLSEKILLVGNTITNKTKEHLASLTQQKIIAIDVDWLDTGHVDEVVSLLPEKKDASICEQTLIHASPQKAIELLQKTKVENVKDLPDFTVKEDSETWPDYFKCLKDSTSKLCQSFFAANKTYEEIIQKNIQIIQKAFQEIHHCQLKELAFPQLFSPLKISKKFGGGKIGRRPLMKTV